MTISPGGLPRLAPSKEQLLFDKSILNQLTSSIDLTKSKIVRSPGFIFLCGGPLSPINNTTQFKSCRDIFYKYIKRNNSIFSTRIVLAEEIFKYFEHSSYEDLLTFERDLAELSSLTVIFSESPGSIAEFGSFAVLTSIKDKLLVVLHQDDSFKESFIWRGPALHLMKRAQKYNKENPISIYNWEAPEISTGYMDEKCFDDAEDLSEVISKIIQSEPKTKIFQTNDRGHVMLLLAELLSIIHLATLDELQVTLNSLGIKIDKKLLESHLSLLVSLNLVAQKPYRNNVYFLSVPSGHWVSIAFNKNAIYRDIIRWKSLFLEDYRKVSAQKVRALRSHLKSQGSIG